VAHDDGPSDIATWLRMLDRISRGRFAPHHVTETWTGESKVTVRFHVDHRWVEFDCALADGTLRSPGALLAGVNAAIEGAAFTRVIHERNDLVFVCTTPEQRAQLEDRGVTFADAVPCEVRSGPSDLARPEPPAAPPPRRDPRKDLEAIAKRGAAKILRLARSTWVPLTELSADSAATNRFGGPPWIVPRGFFRRGQGVPSCTRCGSLLALGLQLDLASLPPPLATSGLFQYLLCANEQCDEQALHHVLRVLDRERAQPTDVHDEMSPYSFPARKIVGWEERRDQPPEYLWSSLGARVRREDRDLVAEYVDQPLETDKLGGWPRPIQELRAPRCDVCRKPMHLFFQIASEGALPIGFGDDGAMFVYTCASHRAKFAGWAESY
jgi:hypothetical protein